MDRETSFYPPGFLEKLVSIPPDFDPEKRLNELTTEMEKHEGEFVLVVTREWERISCGLSPEHYTIDERIYLGILIPPFVRKNDFDFEVLTSKHAVLDLDRRSLKPKVSNGSIQGWGIFTYELEAPVEKKSQEEAFTLTFKDPGLALQIIVGDEAVRNWFEDQTREHLPESSEKLEEGNPELFHGVYSNLIRTEPLVALVKMAELLERPLPEIPKEVEEFIKKQKLAVIDELLVLKQREDKILGKLVKIQGIKPPKFGDGIYFTDIDRLAEEDLGDLKILKSIRPTEELNSVRRKIRETLEQAFELNLHTLEWVISQELEPGVSREIDVKRFIRGYCEFYEIQIPQN